MSIPLTASRGPVDFHSPALVGRTPPVVIKVRVPSLYERDAFAAALVRGGVVHYSKKQVRDLLLAGVAERYPKEEFEPIRADLEELWTVSDEDQRVNALQMQRLAELYDVPEGKPMPDPKLIQEELAKIIPEISIDPIKKAKVVSIQQTIMSTYVPLQKAFADMAEQDAKRAWLNNETYVTGWTGLEHEPDGNGRGGLQHREAEYLRGQIGKEAFEELSDFITAMHGLDGDEEKNLASLIESMSARNGSTQTESKAVSDGGTSTGGRTSRARKRESRKTTGSSSGSGTKSATKRGTSRTTRTGSESSSSP